MNKRLKKKRRNLIIGGSVFTFVFVVFAVYFFFIYLPYLNASSSDLEKCNSLYYSGENAINLVFFGNAELVKKYSDYLFDAYPLNNNKEKFNVYYIDTFSPACDIYKEIALLCYGRETIRKAASCPNDYVVVLQKERGGIRSSAYKNVMSINTAHPLSVIVHEFGHAFANFAEEYTPAKIPRGSENCQEACSDFYRETNGCFSECSDGSHVRSIEFGVMRTLDTNDYGEFNSYLMTKAIQDKYGGESDLVITGRASGGTKDCEKETYVLSSVSVGGVSSIKESGCLSGNNDNTVGKAFLFTDSPPPEKKPETIVDEPVMEIQAISGETFVLSQNEISDAGIVTLPSEEEIVGETTITKVEVTETDSQTQEVVSETIVEVDVSEAIDNTMKGEKEFTLDNFVKAGTEFTKSLSSSEKEPELESESLIDNLDGNGKIIEKEGAVIEKILSSPINITNQTNETFGDFNLTNSSGGNSNGLVGYWNLNEGRGTLAFDSSRNSLSGVLTNEPMWTTGKYSSAVNFDGVDDYISIGNPTPLQLTGSMTISAWVYETADPADDGQIVAKSDSDAGWQFKSSPDTGPRTFAIAVTPAGSSGHTQRYSQTVRTLNTWYYLTGVYDATAQTLNIYVNGALDNGVLTGTIPSSQANSGVSVNIGRRTGGYNLIGKIDEIRIYNRALSPTEILNDMNNAGGDSNGIITGNVVDDIETIREEIFFVFALILTLLVAFYLKNRKH